MKVIVLPSRKDWNKYLKRPSPNALSIEKDVSAILDRVKKNGDKALIRYARMFDGVDLRELAVTASEKREAIKNLSPELKTAIQLAWRNIEKFHAIQKEKPFAIETVPGVKCWRRQVPIEKVGLYIPGGSAPLFSTVLMLGVPAVLAGCKEIILCSPPGKDGKLNAAILYTANLLGIKKIYKVGGAQAIAAMAYGTETIPKVFKIFGPGNRFVTCAKQMVSLQGTAIDLPAGPSEVAVMADETCVPAFVAADLLSQAEHGPDSQVVLVTTQKRIATEVVNEVRVQLKGLPRKTIAQKALENSKIFVVRNQQEAVDLVNEYAPEHLIIACRNGLRISQQITNAGSVFLGNYSCESAGDYASGTNHTLPTGGYAKAYSGVSLDSFMKNITFQQLTRKGLGSIGHAVETMALAEGLYAHKNAVTIRLKKHV